MLRKSKILRLLLPILLITNLLASPYEYICDMMGTDYEMTCCDPVDCNCGQELKKDFELDQLDATKSFEKYNKFLILPESGKINKIIHHSPDKQSIALATSIDRSVYYHILIRHCQLLI